MLDQGRMYPETYLTKVFEELSDGCGRFVSISKAQSGGASSTGKTKLDKERHKLSAREMVRLGSLEARKMVGLGSLWAREMVGLG